MKPTSVMTTSEVAEHLRCSKRHVRCLIRNGKLRATRLCDGGRYRIFEESVDSLLGIRVQQPSEAALIRETSLALVRAGLPPIPGAASL